MRFDPKLIINFYMFICLALLAYNIGYILRGRYRRSSRPRRVERFRRSILAEAERIDREGPSPRAEKKLFSGLKKLKNLLIFHEAMVQGLAGADREAFRRFLDAYSGAFRSLCEVYGKRPPMERAFFAHLLAAYRPRSLEGSAAVCNSLLKYLEDSTVYCRENVLQALYALGNEGAVIQAMNILDINDYYHYPRLISDGLAAWPGDKEALARRLWDRCGRWKDHLQVAVVQFAADVSDSLSERFLEALRDPRTLMETRFALVRYFRRHPRPEAEAVLLGLLREQYQEGGLAIPAAAALESYPGEASVIALTEAVRSRNWYVRRNAAASLVKLGGSQEALRALDDRYAREMLEYMQEVIT